MSDHDDVTPGLFISPTEPPYLRTLGETSSVPEKYGVDMLWAHPDTGLWGIQRKEISDLIASRSDGRLSKELGQLAGRVDNPVLVVEGLVTWTNEGVLMGEWMELHRHQYHGMLWSIRLRGAWVDFTDDLAHTRNYVRWLYDWSKKERHSGMRNRPNPVGNWGHVSSREWGIHFLMGLEGIGPEMAGRIYDHFDGVPLEWKVTKKELMEVPGVGKGRAERMMKALEPEETP